MDPTRGPADSSLEGIADAKGPLGLGGHDNHVKSRAARKYSNPAGRERLTRAAVGQLSAPTTTNDLAAREFASRKSDLRQLCLPLR